MRLHKTLLAAVIAAALAGAPVCAAGSDTAAAKPGYVDMSGYSNLYGKVTGFDGTALTVENGQGVSAVNTYGAKFFDNKDFNASNLAGIALGSYVDMLVKPENGALVPCAFSAAYVLTGIAENTVPVGRFVIFRRGAAGDGSSVVFSDLNAAGLNNPDDTRFSADANTAVINTDARYDIGALTDGTAVIVWSSVQAHGAPPLSVAERMYVIPESAPASPFEKITLDMLTTFDADTKLTIDGVPADPGPDSPRNFIDAGSGELMVQLAAVAKALGTEAVWNGGDRTVDVPINGAHFIFAADNSAVGLDDWTKNAWDMGAKARIVGGRTYIPLSFVLLHMAFRTQDAAYDRASNTIYLFDKE